MKTEPDSTAELREENAELRARLEEAEETLRAIRAGDVDAMVVGGQIYSLKNAETPYRRLVESINEGAATLLDDTTVLYCNRRLGGLLHAPMEEIVGSPLRRFVEPADQPAFDALLAEGSRGSAFGELRLLRRGAPPIPVDFSAGLFDSEGARTVCVIVTDISERKRAEATLRRSELELTEAQRIARIGSWWVDAATGEVRWTEELFRMLGRDPASKPPDFAEHGRLFTPGSWQRLSAALRRTQETGEPYELELEMVRADGTKGWMLARGEQVRSPGGEVVGLRGMAQDITERKQVEEMIRRMNSELEQRVKDRTAALEEANRQLESFSYSVSHDLRAPLRAMDGFSRIALTQSNDLSPESREALQIVRDSAQQMGRLIDDLLTFSRMSRQPVHKQAVSPVALVRECLETLRPEIAGRHVEIATGELPVCEADPALLKLVWMNLLSNALKFTRPRDPARIEIGARTEAGETVYFVRDNGVGFKMAYADKLFGVFQRLHRAEDFEGTGVGLATSQRIVQRHGGRIWAVAELNRGATFSFTLEPRKNP